MITNGTHSSKETPPQVPMITGATFTSVSKRKLEDTIASTITAVMKGMEGGTQQPQNTSTLQSTIEFLI